MVAVFWFGTVFTLVHHVADSVLHFFARFAVRDWLLLGGGLIMAACAWIRAVAFVRLGSLEIDDLDADAAAPQAKQVGAELQASLAARGALPTTGVPGGAPSAAAIGAAIADAPLSQAKWIGDLVGLLPVPPTKTGFKVTGTLLMSATTDTTPCGLAYQVVCNGPRPDVTVRTVWSTNWLALVEAAAHSIFDDMEKSAPDLYPSWARWSRAEAYEYYVRGDALERKNDLHDAKSCFMRAWDLDPNNMLALLRIANCNERIAMTQDDAGARYRSRVEALSCYAGVRSRQPDIFQAGYRASLVMSALASAEIDGPAASDLWLSINDSLDALARTFDPAKSLERLRLGIAKAIRLAWTKVSDVSQRAVRFATRASGPATVADSNPRARLNRYAELETSLARLRVRPLWTVIHENRFRHQFEPRGRDRRQIRKALGISEMCGYARRAARRPAKPSDALQFVWRGWVLWRYMFGRWRVAGWQAHYNAACFYALLPPGSQMSSRSGQRGALLQKRIVARAFRHLATALTEAGYELPRVYVQDDRDLEWLRTNHNFAFERTVGTPSTEPPGEGSAPCQAYLTVRYMQADADGPWGLHVWGDATIPINRAWDDPLTSEPSPGSDVVFRVAIVDQNAQLNLLPHKGEKKDLIWTLIPAEWPAEIWLIPGNLAIFTAGVPVQRPAEH
jgi:tetratricopeptide (TPR) repeat protein